MPGPRCLQQRCTCSGTNEAQKPVPYRRLADSVGASRTSGNASYRLCAQIKDERSVRWCNRLEWNHLASFVEDPSIECGQPRHACCDEAAQRLLESRKGHSTGGVRPWLSTAFSASNTETEWSWIMGQRYRRAYGRCLVGEQVNWSGGQARAYAWQVRVRCCISCIMNVTDHR